MKLFFLLILTLIWNGGIASSLNDSSQVERLYRGEARSSYPSSNPPDSLPQSIQIDYRGQIQVVVAPEAKTFKKRVELLETDKYYQAAVSYLQQQLGSRGYYLRDLEEAILLGKELEHTGKMRIDAQDLMIMGPSVDVFVNVSISAFTHTKGDQQIEMEVKAIDKYTSKPYTQIPWRSSNKRFGASPLRHVKDVLDIDSVLIKFIEQFDQSIHETLQRSEVIIESLNEKDLPLEQKILATGSLVTSIAQWIDKNTEVTFSFVSGLSRRLFRFQANNQLSSTLNPFLLGSALKHHIEEELRINKIEFEEVGLRLVGKRIYIYIK